MPLQVPPGFSARPFTMSDAAAVATLVGACERHFMGESFVDATDIAGQWSTPGIDLAADSIGIFDGRVMAAGALVDDRHHLAVDVHPSRLGRGLGSALAAWVEDRARDRGLSHGLQESAVADLAAADLMQRRGYERTYRDWVLRMEPDEPLSRHELPSDVTIGGFSEDDATAVYSVIEDAFAEWDGRIARSYRDWRTLFVDRVGVAVEHFRVARAAGEVIGVAMVHDSAGTTWIPQLAVRADRRGQGIAQELLAEAFEAGRRRGCATGELSTSGLTGALGLYQRLGMRIVAEFQTWRITLSPDVP
ncbi:GNAT family N-acetyltransferase [Aeromicrobium sp. A1-2]|uniref:GNAT family N-acetyltransferase n=1 Tax=Aeromicrobium sp. A1-2 TaxID=2107713 RepID=UPI0013C2D7C2|nr:GNAT family N-acetyltransferase [Aeromicrobium sp. A1-2]